MGSSTRTRRTSQRADAANTTSEPAKRQKSQTPSAESLLPGTRLEVYWELDKKHFPGEIISYNSKTKKHKVKYDDGDVENINLANESYRLLAEVVDIDSEEENKPLVAAADDEAASHPSKSSVLPNTMANFVAMDLEKPAVLQEAAGAAPTKENPASPEPNKMSDYEAMREENIRRNMERMAALNIPVLSKAVAPEKKAAPATAKVKGASAKSKAAAVPAVSRRSLRQAGCTPDGREAAGVDHERRDGTIVLVNGEAIRVRDEAPSAAPPRPSGPLPFATLHGTPDTDEAFLEVLRSSALPAGDSKPTAKDGPSGCEWFTGLRLSGDDVARVVPNSAVHLAFHPSPSMLLLAAGDKNGNVGLWQVDADGSAASGTDGVHTCRPHHQYISGLKWVPDSASSSRLVTASYDGTVRTLDAEAGVFAESFASAEDEFSALDLSADGRSAFLGDNEGCLHVLDLRSASRACPALEVHRKKINTVSLDPASELLLATSSGDGATGVQVWDVRKLAPGVKPLGALAHSKGVQSCYFAPDGSQRLLSTCYDDYLRVWTPPSASGTPDWTSGKPSAQHKPTTMIRHNNNTGRWISPFRPIWTPDGAGILVGSMNRSAEVFDPQSGKAVAKLQDPEVMTAIPARNTVHPAARAVACATASRVFIWR